jgi:hypothetical protein
VKRILALDLGCHTGVAHTDAKAPDGFTCFTLDLNKLVDMKAARERRLDRRADPRVLRFFEWLQERIGLFDIVVWEDVQFSETTMQTQLWSSFRTAVWLAFGGRNDCFVDCVPVGSLKKFATGSGAAGKPDMARALMRRFPERFAMPPKGACKRIVLYDRFTQLALTDDAVDGSFLLLWAQNYLSKI